MDIEKVETGSLVIITGEYEPVPQENFKIEETLFLANGQVAPDAGKSRFWQLVEPIDFAS